jgi:hypothetical protein
MKCIVKDCRNHSDEGKFVGDLCFPCFRFLTTGEGRSQAYTNTVLAEREACAKVCDEESSSLGGVAEGPFVTDFGKHTHMSMAAGAQNCAANIRARGQKEYYD